MLEDLKVDVNVIMNHLASRIAELEKENAVLNAKISALTENKDK